MRTNEALTAALAALEAVSAEMTVGERFTNAGQAVLDALGPVRAALSIASAAQMPDFVQIARDHGGFVEQFMTNPPKPVGVKIPVERLAEFVRAASAALASAPPAAEPVGYDIASARQHVAKMRETISDLRNWDYQSWAAMLDAAATHLSNACNVLERAEPAQPATQAGAVINGRPATAESILAALVDIDDDARQNAPEDRCYVESAWSDAMKLARHFVAQPTAQPSQDAERYRWLRDQGRYNGWHVEQDRDGWTKTHSASSLDDALDAARAHGEKGSA